MINTIAIYNQNIIGPKEKFRLVYENRYVFVLLIQNPLSGIRPHLFSASVDSCIYFQKSEIKNTTGVSTVSQEEYESRLLRFLPTYIANERLNIKSKMDLLRVNFSINDIAAVRRTMRYMNTSPNIRMLSFILRNSEEASIKEEGGVNEERSIKQETPMTGKSRMKNYTAFLNTCKGIDYRSAYIFAVEILHIFNTSDLIRLCEDMQLLFRLKISNKVISLPRLQEKASYNLKILLCIRIISELTSREKFRAAGTMLVYLAKTLSALEDIPLLEEVLSLAFGLINSPHDMLDDLFRCENFTFYLSNSQVFYIRSRFLIKRKEEISSKSQWQQMLISQCKDIHKRGSEYTVKVLSHSSIFEFSAVEKILDGVFTDRVRIEVRDGKKKEITVMGVVDDGGAFYPCDRNVITAPRDISGGTIILPDGLQIESVFKMKRLERKTDIYIIDITEIDESERIKEKPGSREKLRVFKFMFKDGKKCNYSFPGAVYRTEDRIIEDDIIEVCFPFSSDRIEGNIEISPGIYERRIYMV